MNLGGSVKINKCGVTVIIVIVLIIVYNTISYKNHSLLKNPNEINLRKLLIGVIQASQMGGIEVYKVSKELFVEQKVKGQTKEGVDEPVTAADFKSHCVIQLSLSKIFPNLKLVSEENVPDSKCPPNQYFDFLNPTVLSESVQVPDVHVKLSDLTVFIDPLDATKEYTEKLFHFVTVMVCVAYKGEPIIGVIHNPFANVTYWAWKDQATSENLAHVKKSDDEVIKNPVIIVSRSHAGSVKELAEKSFGQQVKILTGAGSGYKVVQLINGNATCYLHSTFIKKWDICAGNAILNSVGGQMTTLKNENIIYTDDDVLNKNGLIATLNNHQKYVEKLSVT